MWFDMIQSLAAVIKRIISRLKNFSIGIYGLGNIKFDDNTQKKTISVRQNLVPIPYALRLDYVMHNYVYIVYNIYIYTYIEREKIIDSSVLYIL